MTATLAILKVVHYRDGVTSWSIEIPSDSHAQLIAPDYKMPGVVNVKGPTHDPCWITAAGEWRDRKGKPSQPLVSRPA